MLNVSKPDTHSAGMVKRFKKGKNGVWQLNYGATTHQVSQEIPSFPTQIFHAGKKKISSVEDLMILLLSIKLEDGNEITKCM